MYIVYDNYKSLFLYHQHHHYHFTIQLLYVKNDAVSDILFAEHAKVRKFIEQTQIPHKFML